MTSAREHHLAVTRTARYHTLGEPSAALREVWFVLHGHAQLSGYFIRHFAALDDGTRMVVAPEGLNRFYLEQTHWKGAGQARVGATWMTREDRLIEIEDYVRYLDALYNATFAEVARAQVRFVVLGFSQGVATACRWLARGDARADTLVLWAGPLPAELDATTAARLRTLKVIRVMGDADEMATPEAVAAEDARLAVMQLDAPTLRFPGGHQLDAAVLRGLQV
jgi:predicted esterase